ncbi:MAG: nucleotidyltransferase family protein [Rubrimonas sp.]|uniref:nucleotidyltransferase family protein n=1 Tax=Rubrimonas sp. TaxID=2036015 RepID=UPI002FDD1449
MLAATAEPSDEAERRARLAGLFAADPRISALLAMLRAQGPQDCWLVSGALYATLWNALTGRPPAHGIKDFDIAYFDPDLSEAAEAREIARFERAAASLGLCAPVEPRNQARVHLWYPARFGARYPRLRRATQSLRLYASRCHAVAARLGPDGLEIEAPFGLSELFEMRVVPNRILPNRATHEEKGARILRRWPEAVVEPW